MYLNGKNYSIYIQRLVAIEFISNPENKEEVNHKKGIKTDNRAISLEWMTPQENVIHSIENGLKKKVKLTAKEVLEIRENNMNQYRLAEQYGISQQTVSEIKTRKTWKHI